VAVAGVFAVADVGYNQKAGNFALDGAYSPLHNPVIVIGAGTFFVLRFRKAEQYYAADSQPANFPALFHCHIDRQLALRGHGTDRPPNPFAGHDKQRKYEIRRIKERFAHKAAHGFARSQAAGPLNREGHLN
jgi:hypothetical protein